MKRREPIEEMIEDLYEIHMATIPPDDIPAYERSWAAYILMQYAIFAKGDL